jgi:cytochrome P450
MGIPEEDRADFRRWSDSMIEIIDATDPDRIATLQGDLDEARSYFRQELQRRRAEPRDDMLSDIANGTVEGEPLQLPAQVRYATLMLSAGNETTRNLFSGGVKALMDYPEQLRLLQADESLVPLAVDELLRWTTPVNATGRTALEPAELEGQQIAVGDYIVMLYQSANRDERVWDRPGTLNIARKPIPMHEAFGTGQHVCLGQHVARFEARIMFEETFRRFRSVEPAGDPVWSNSTHVNGLAALPVIFQAA